MATQTQAPAMVDTFTFSTLDGGVTMIYQHYAKETSMGAISTPVVQIKDGKLSFCTERPPAALVDFGRLASDANENGHWPEPCEGCNQPATTQSSDGVDLCRDCYDDNIKDNEAADKSGE